MKYLVAKDKKNRVNYTKFEKRRLLLKAITNNQFLDVNIQNKIIIYLKNIIVYKSRIKNYCLITARARGVLRNYNISRILFKQYASYGYLKGIKKASW